MCYGAIFTFHFPPPTLHFEQQPSRISLKMITWIFHLKFTSEIDFFILCIDVHPFDLLNSFICLGESMCPTVMFGCIVVKNT